MDRLWVTRRGAPLRLPRESHVFHVATHGSLMGLRWV